MAPKLIRRNPALTSKYVSSSGLLRKVVVEKDGALMVVNSEHPSNAKREMAARFVGKRREVREEQF